MKDKRQKPSNFHPASNSGCPLADLSFKPGSTPPRLPLIISNGRFKHLSLMKEEELEMFLSYLVRFTCEKYAENPVHTPPWWTESVAYPPLLAYSCVIPDTRNKHVKMRRLIKLCYLHYECKDLLVMSERLANLNPSSYTFIRLPCDLVIVYQSKTRCALVTLPSSNIDYDRQQKQETTVNKIVVKQDAAITHLRKPQLAYRIFRPANYSDDDCIVIDSSSDTSSDDEVEIVSYEPGALPPTPPRRLPFANRPGPACSKNRLPNRPPMGPYPVVRSALSMGLKPPLLAPQKVVVPARRKYLLCRPRRHIQVEEVDLTISDDEEEVQPTHPKDLSISDFLGRMGLTSSCAPAATSGKSLPPPKEFKKSHKVNVKGLSLSMVPRFVERGLLPRKALCSSAELVRRMSFIERHTSKDTNWFKVTVDVRNKAAVGRLIKKCTVRVKILTTAGLRRWRR